MANPLIQIDGEIREMTDEELAVHEAHLAECGESSSIPTITLE